MISQESTYLEAIKTNDPEGLRALYQAFQPRIGSFIQRNGGTTADAEDVFQDALIIIYQKSKATDFELSSKFYTLLYGVCRNLWGNRLQKKSRTEVELKDEYHYQQVADVSGLVERAEEDRLFWESFQLLGQDCQALLKLFFAKVKMEDITRRLGLSSVSYTKKKKFKCKEKLVRHIKADPRFKELRTN